MSISHTGTGRPDKRRRQAAEWMVIRRGGRKLSSVREKRWQKWVADPQNQAEYQGYERLYLTLQGLPRPPLPSDAQLCADTSTSAWESISHARIANVVKQWCEGARVAHIARVACAVGGCAAALVVAVALFVRGTEDTQAHMYETRSGGRLDISLVDHSTVSMGGATRLTVLLTKQGAHVRLDRGEAAFQVARNPRQVFQVEAGGIVITNLGTRFKVRRYADQQILVTVADGAVAVMPRRHDSAGGETGGSRIYDAKKVAPVKVTKGHEASSNAAGVVTVRDVPLWEGSSLLDEPRDYMGRPLREVVDDAQMYVQSRIELDPDIGDTLYSGGLRPDAAEAWVRKLPNIYPVEIIDDAEHHRLVVRCRNSACGVKP